MVPRFNPALSWREILALLYTRSGAVQKFEKEFAKKFNAADALLFLMVGLHSGLSLKH